MLTNRKNMGIIVIEIIFLTIEIIFLTEVIL